MESKSYLWRHESSFKSMYRNVMLHHLNIRPLCFMWRLTYSGEFLAVVQSLKNTVCLRKFNSTVCERLGQDDYATFEHSVYGTFTDWQTIIVLAWMIPSFFLIPPIAYYLQHGRKKIAIVVMALLQLLSSVMYMLNAYYPEMYVSGYVTAAVLQASYGFTYGFRLITYAYLADITASYTPERRSAEMIFQSSFRALGAVCSPYLMGYLLTHFGVQYAFMASCVCDGLMLVYCAFLVEVRPAMSLKGTPVDQKGAEPAETDPLQEHDASKQRGIRGFFAPLLAAKTPILHVVIVYAILETLTITTFNFLPIYLTHSPYSFTSVDLGLYQTIQYTLAFVGALGVSQVFTRVVGNQDVGIAMSCILSRFFMYGVLMLASSKLLLYVALLSEALNYSYVGALYSYATSITGKKGFVPLFTLMSQVGLLSCAVTYPMVNLLFKKTALQDPKMVFVLLLSLAGLAFVVWVYHIFWKQRALARAVRLRTTSQSQMPDINDAHVSTKYGTIENQARRWARHNEQRPSSAKW